MVTGSEGSSDEVEALLVQSSGLHDEPSPPHTSHTS